MMPYQGAGAGQAIEVCMIFSSVIQMITDRCLPSLSPSIGCVCSGQGPGASVDDEEHTRSRTRSV